MNAKWLYVFMILVILAILGVIAWLTPMLFDASVSSPSAPRTARVPAEHPAIEPPQPVTEVNVLIPPPAPAPTPAAFSPAAPDALPSLVSIPAPKSPSAPASQPPAAPLPGVGTVTVAQGDVSATDTAMRRRSLAVDARVLLNETIATGAGARLRIRLDDGSDVSQGENGSMVLDEYLVNASRVEDTRFSMRVIRGICRVVTGIITEINPDRFRVQTRMSTIGIRGCDVAVKTSFDREEIFVVALSSNRTVRIEAAVDGSPLRNIQTGQPIEIPAARRKIIDVAEPRTLVLLAAGKPPETREARGDELRDLAGETSHLSPTRYDILQRPDGAVLTVHPGSERKTAPAQPK